ncbi:hypothetical protein EGW08_012506, partial [Elysia chlorotica]
AKSGFSGASSTISSCSGSVHSNSTVGKTHKRDGFPNRQPLKNGGLPGKRRHNNYNNINNTHGFKDKNVLKGDNNNNNVNTGPGQTKGASIVASEPVSLTLKIPSSNDSAYLHPGAQKTWGISKVRPNSGVMDIQGHLDAEHHATSKDIKDTNSNNQQACLHISPNTSPVSLQQKRGFHGRPPLRPAPSKVEHPNSRQASDNSTPRRPSPGTATATTPIIRTPDVDAAQLLLEDSDGRGRSDPLLMVSLQDRGKESSTDIQLLLSGAGFSSALAVNNKSPRRHGTSLSGHNRHKPGTKLVTSRSDSKVPQPRQGDRCPSHARHCDACAIDYVRQWLRQTVSATTRQEEELTNSTIKAFYEPLQLIKTFGPEEFSRIRSAPLM